MSPLSGKSWPALGLAPSGPLLFRCQRAVRGKVHRAATDYRWIAASPGLPVLSLGWEARLSLGIEDDPQVLFMWVGVEHGFLAARCYPSRARDATGRHGGLEKHLLYWRQESELAAGVAAFTMLSAAGRFSDSVWWDSWNDPRWADMQYVLPIDESENPPLKTTQSALQASVESGLSEIASLACEEDLAAFYDGLMSGREASILFGIKRPLSGPGLAALLLPLQPVDAARISLAGGVASTQFQVDRIRHWSGVVCPLPAPRIDRSLSDQAIRMARAVMEGRPELLDGPTAKLPANPCGRHLRAFLASDRRSMYGARLPHDVAFSPVRSKDEASDLVDTVIDFERCIRADSMDQGEVKLRDARHEHLQAKADEAKAWLYVFAPGPQTISTLPPNPGGRVPALWFLQLLRPEDWTSLETSYAEDELEVLFRHSLAPQRRCEQILDWLQRFVEDVRNPSRRDALLPLLVLDSEASQAGKHV